MAEKDHTDKVFAALQRKMAQESYASQVRKGLFGNLFDESRKNALNRAYNPKTDPKSDRYSN